MRTDPSRWWWRLQTLRYIGMSVGVYATVGVWTLGRAWVPVGAWMLHEVAGEWLAWSLWLAAALGVTLMEVALIGTWALERRGKICVDCGTLIVRRPDPPDVVRLDLSGLLGVREPCPVCTPPVRDDRPVDRLG